MCLMCLDIDCSKRDCKNIKYKRYFLPLIFTPTAALHPEVFNFYYFPLVVGFSAFILGIFQRLFIIPHLDRYIMRIYL